MTPQDTLRTELCKISKVVQLMDPSALLEMAGLGSLIDWEIVNLLEDGGYELSRLSFTWKPDEVLLVVKVIADGTPQVVFISRDSPMGCIRTFCRQLKEKVLRMYPDKFS